MGTLGSLLVVDDETAFLRHVPSVFSGSGFEVETATGYDEAIGRCGQRKFTSALIDLAMPEHDGVDVAVALRQRNRETAVSFLSAVDRESYRAKAARLDLQDCDWLSKPLPSQDEQLEQLFDRLRGNEVQRRFAVLSADWRYATQLQSSMTVLAMHPAYQRIIGMGEPALRHILKDLERHQEHWFWALKAISGEDPVPRQDRGDVAKMARAWLQWGREHGYGE